MVYIKEEIFDDEKENSGNLFVEECNKLTRVVQNVTKKQKRSKPKVVSKWSDNEVFKLIACVHQHPGLWDARNSQYHKKHERAKLWNKLSKNELSKFGATELLAKWSNIRIQYRSYANKKLKSRRGAPPPISWKFYKAMQFISRAACKEIPSTKSNLNIEKSDTSIGNIPISCISLAPRISRKRRLSVTTVAPATSTTTSHSATTSKQQAEHGDEFEAFGKFLASELRSLNDIAMARRIKYKLNRYFLDIVDEEHARRTNYFF